MSFTHFDLDPRLLRGIQAAGYTAPTPIQQAAIPPALAGHDLIGTAQTGTGKTAAFVLPILHRLLKDPRPTRGARALIVTPTRELAEQINTTFRELGQHTGLRSAAIYGGVGMGHQERAFRDGVEVLVACPGRLLDHLDRRTAKLNHLDVLVLDEADRMFDMGFLPAIRRLLTYVPARRQTMLFSATFPTEVDQLAAQVLSQPKRIAVGLTRPAETVSHALYPIAPHLKTDLVLALLQQTDTRSVLIFTRTKHRASRLAEQIARAGHRVTSLHSNRSQNQRQAALDGFRSGKYQIMVATDIAARGIDVESISHVINYDIPDTADAYIHRIGRTGRAEREGDAFTLITHEDADMVRTIERAIGQSLARQRIKNFDYAEPPPQRTTPARPASAPQQHAPTSAPSRPVVARRPAISQRRRARGPAFARG